MKLLARRIPATLLVALAQALLALTVPGYIWQLRSLSDHLASVNRALGIGTYGAYALASFVVLCELLVPPTLFMGLSFPSLVAVVARRAESAPADLGLLYAWNTLGAIAGALAAPIVLIPVFGLQRALVVLACLALAGGLLELGEIDGGEVDRHGDTVEGVELQAPDPEDVHQARVAARRMRSDLRTFRDALERGTLCICAAGNDGGGAGNEPDHLTVKALDLDGNPLVLKAVDSIRLFGGDDVTIEAGATIDPDTLRAKGIVPKKGPVKVLGRGEVDKALTVRADASASTDPDPRPIASYRFDFGDGMQETNTTGTATHAYTAPGQYQPSVTVSDDANGSAQAKAEEVLSVDRVRFHGYVS